MTAYSLTRFFYPENVLLVGASSKPQSIGYEILKSIINFGFKGKVFVVNPKANEILGIKCNKTIEDIDEDISLAIILVPKNLVFDSLKSCARKQIKNVVIITAGFREVGDEGAELEKQITNFAKENGIRLIGPNCMGLINTDEDIRLNATFAAEVPHYSPISFLSQSGALAAAVLNTISLTGYSFGQFASIGNKADVNENDLLEFWWKDDKTKVITMYLESFEDGRKFFDLANQITKEKPVIVLKAARTKSGSSAASSHTGALATQDDIVEAALFQSGCIRVNTIEEMFETANSILRLKEITGKRIAVLTNAGGPAILCVDEIEKQGLEISELDEDTKSRLKEFLHPEASIKNPVDMLPGADANTYRKAAKILSEDENVDAIIVIFVEPVMIDSFEVIYQLAEEQQINSKPILIVTFPLPHFWEKWKQYGIRNSIILKSVELAPVILKNLFSYHLHKIKHKEVIVLPDNKIRQKVKKILISAKENSFGSFFLTSKESFKILSSIKLPVAKSKFFKTKKELLEIADIIQYPCVLKISSRKFTHKSDIGGVILNIPNKNSLIKSFADLQLKLTKRKLTTSIDEFEIQEFFDGDFEIIIGGYRDSSFGPVVLFGAGGKVVEIIQDKNLRLAPLSQDDAFEMIKSSKIYSLLKGYRDFKAIDLNLLAELLIKTSQLIFEFNEIKEIDLNPVMIKGQKIKIVDYRIKID
ncbi:MAG: acetate--CoA ligase family protein [Ignavibacteria bacterium]